ncbi:3-hexulose-6-phosphate isomerase [archaeon HR06]|nr:3-hexulose-6-phosphate isomerase [archaeon HR06]
MVTTGLEVKNVAFGFLTMITQTISQVSDEEITMAIKMIKEHHDSKILLIGMGRSGLVARAFALRLLHLGFKVYVLGDTLVPSIEQKDLVIAISGSGTTRLILATVEAAKHIGAKILVFTSFPDSPLGKLADCIVKVKGRIIGEDESGRDYFARQVLGLHEPLAPLGTLFEDSCMILLDAFISILMKELNITEEEMGKRHANIE